MGAIALQNPSQGAPGRPATVATRAVMVNLSDCHHKMAQW